MATAPSAPALRVARRVEMRAAVTIDALAHRRRRQAGRR